VRALSLWLAGVGFVQVGHVSVRILAATMPTELTVHAAPVWSVALVAASAWLHLRVSKALRERPAWARNAAVALVAAWTIAVYVEVNTEAGRVGDMVPTAVEDGKVVESERQTHLSAATGASWQAVGWPAIVTHPQDYSLVPTGAWGAPEIVAVALQTALGVGLLGYLLSKSGTPLPAPDPADGRAVARHALAALREDARRTPGLRLLSYGVAAWLGLAALATVLMLVTVSAVVFRRSTRRADVERPRPALALVRALPRAGPSAGP